MVVGVAEGFGDWRRNELSPVKERLGSLDNSCGDERESGVQYQMGKRNFE